MSGRKERYSSWQYLHQCGSALLFICTAASTSSYAEGAAEPARFAEARSIEVDGRLTERAWLETTPVTAFFETYPRSVAEPNVATEARFLSDDSYIYVGVTAYDPDPARIRSGFVKRDSIEIDQDYIEVFLDPLNTRRTAYSFATNPHGVQRDGQFSDETLLLDTRPDFDFDVRASVNALGWQAEFRIPLSTFRYRVGKDQTWAFVIHRNRPRVIRTTIESIPEPRKATCRLCFAGEVRGISINASALPLYLTPQVTYAHSGDSHQARGSVDVKWVPRSDTVVDLTILPDFSQVEADDLQLTANARFALAVKEKRPFFLEGLDLLSTPIAALYTRSFAEPLAGMRITNRGDSSDYSAILLRDRSGGLLLEPGARSSFGIVQPFDSTAMVGRYKRGAGAFTWGGLASARRNDGAHGGENYVYGVDGAWSPTVSDRFSAQLLASTTTNPDRIDILPIWDGRHFTGSAYFVDWRHASDRWYATLSHSALTGGFRTWNGFVPQVDVEILAATTGLMLRPASKPWMRVTPGFAYTSIGELGGAEISSDFTPSLTVSLPRETEMTIGWTSAASNVGTGRHEYDYCSLTLSATPASWMPGVELAASAGDGVNFASGDITAARSVTASMALRPLNRLELIASIGDEAHDSRTTGARLVSQHNTQLDLLWHFSSDLYAQVAYRRSRIDFSNSDGDSASRTSSVERTFSALLSYQANWQTRYYIGARRNDLWNNRHPETTVFAKIAYSLSK